MSRMEERGASNLTERPKRAGFGTPRLASRYLGIRSTRIASPSDPRPLELFVDLDDDGAMVAPSVNPQPTFQVIIFTSPRCDSLFGIAGSVRENKLHVPNLMQTMTAVQ
jgi:hypothetical protein